MAKFLSGKNNQPSWILDDNEKSVAEKVRVEKAQSIDAEALKTEASNLGDSIINRLNSKGYKTSDILKTLTRDIYKYNDLLSKLSLIGYDVDEHQEQAQLFREESNSQTRYYSQFKTKSEYNNYSYSHKYKGKTVKEIDEIILGFKDRPFFTSPDNQEEFKWLIENRDSFLTTDELKQVINELESKSAGLKSDKYKSVFTVEKDFKKSRNAETENQEKLDRYKKMLAQREDVSTSELEEKYREADRSIFDVFKSDYTFADYANDKADKRIFGSEYKSRQDNENLQVISENKDEFDEDAAIVQGVIYRKKGASDIASSSLGGSLSNILNSKQREEEIFNTDPEIQAIVKKWSDKGYDFTSLYETFKENSNANYTELMKEKAAEETKNNPVLSNIISVGTNLIGGISALPEAVSTGLKDLLSDDIVTMDTNSPAWGLKNYTDTVRGTTSEIISENNPGIKGEFFNFLYQTGMSTADFLSTAAVSGFAEPATLLIMGSNAAIDTMKNVTDNGGSASDALLMGALTGLFEALCEKVSVEAVFKSGGTTTGKEWLYNLFKGMVSEGSEELATDLLNTTVDTLLNADQSEFKQNVYANMRNGMSASEANAKVFAEKVKEMGMSFAGGALSGGVMSGGGGALGLASANRAYSNIGSDVQSAEGGTDAVMQLARELVAQDQDNDGKLAYDIKKAEKNSNNVNVGRMFTDVQSAIDVQSESILKTEMIDGIKDRVETLGLDSSTSQKAAEIIYKAYSGEKLTVRQQSILDNNKYVQRAYKELLASESETGRENYSTEWVDEVQTRAVAKVNDAQSGLNSVQVKMTDAKVKNTAASATTTKTETVSDDKTPANMTEEEAEKKIAKIAGTDENVTINKIVEKTDGGVIAETTDGQEVFIGTEKSSTEDLETVVFEDMEMNKAVIYASNYESTETANAFIKTVAQSDISNVTEFQKDFNAVYKQGMNGEEMNTEGLSITKAQAEIAYTSGQYDSAVAPISTRVKVTGSNINEIIQNNSFEAGITRLDRKQNLTHKQEAQLKVLDAFGKKHGLSFITVNMLGNDVAAANGAYYGDNKIVISLGSEAGAYLSVAGHEVYHYLEEVSPEAAQGIRQFVINYLKNVSDKYDYDARFEKLAKRYGTENVDEIESEMTANAMFEVLNNEQTVKELAEENPSLLEKIRDALQKFIKELKDVIKSLAWDERAALDEQVEMLDAIRYMFNEALKNVDANKNTAQEDGVVKLSIKPTQAQINNMRSVGRKSVNDFTSADIRKTEYWAKMMYKQLGIKSPFFRAWFGDWRVNDRTPVTIATRKGSNRGIVKNSDTGWNINVSRKIFNETISHNAVGNKSAVQYLNYVEDIIKCAVLLDTYVIDKSKSENSLFMHSFYAIADIGNGKELLKLYVEEMNNPNSSDTSKRAYQLQNIEKQQIAVTGLQMKSASRISQSTVTNTVADLFAVVKEYDENFNPNPVSKVVDENGYPKVVYHGTKSNFTVFDRSKSEKKLHLNVLGDGNYFTVNKDAAAHFGENVIGAYVNIVNPYVFRGHEYNTVADQIADEFSIDRSSIKGSQVQAFLKKKGYDGVITVDNNVVNAFDSNQIKDATGNIGTFDKGNPDIRYSFAGPKARNANKSLLGEAIRLENAEKLTKEEIRKQTGWFRGYDGKWRFEIDDSKMKVSTSGKYSRNPDIRRYQELTEKIYFEDNATEEEHNEYRALSKSLDGVSTRPQKLGDLIEHDKLFAAYPQLEGISFRLEKDTGNANGWYSEFDNEIVVRQNLALKPEELKKTLIHEIQHAIQHIENFSTGANPEYFEDYENARYNTLAYINYVKAENRLKAYMQYAEEDISEIVGVYNSETVYLGLTQSEYNKAYDRAAKQIKNEDLLDVFWDYAEAREGLFTELSETENETPKDSYMKTAGEIEARDTAKRLNYNEDYRKSIRPDIDRSDVIFVDGALSYSADESVFDSFGIEKHGDYIHVQRQVYNTLQSEGFFTDDGGKSRTVKNIETGMFIEINKGGIDETFNLDNYARRSKKLKTAKLATIRMLPEIIENGELLDKSIENYHKVNSSLTYMYLQNTVKINGKFTDVKVSVRISPLKNKFHVHHVYIEKGTGINEVGNNVSITTQTNSDAKQIVSQPSDDVKMKFSLQETSDAAKAREELLKANDNLRVANTVLKNELKTTHGKSISIKDAEKIAKQMLREFNSKYDSAQLTESIYNIFRYYDSEENNPDYVIDYLTTVAKDVVSKSEALDSTLYDEYADLRKTIRNMRFALPDHVLRQLNENHDGKFRQNTFGKMRLVSKESNPDVMYLSAMYSELADEYPNFFSIEDNEYEQPQKLLDFWEAVQPSYSDGLTEMGFKSDSEAAVSFAYMVFDKYLDTPSYKTFADKKEKQLESVRKEFSRNLNEAKKKFRAERDEKVEKVKEYYRERMANERIQRQYTKHKEVMRNDIIRKVRRLGNMLTKATDQKHIPEHLKEMTTKFLNLFTNDSVVFDENVMTTIKDNYYKILKDKTGELDVIKQYYDPDIYNDLDALADSFRSIDNGQRLAKLDGPDLQRIQYVTDHFCFIIENANEIFAEGKRQSFSKIVTDVITELNSQKSKTVKKAFDATSWNSTPYYFFKRIGGTFNKLFNDLLEGQHKYGLLVAEARAFMEPLQEKYHVSSWINDSKSIVEFEGEDGEKLGLTVDEALGIYAVSRREATSSNDSKHLTEGGIIFTDKKNKGARKTLSIEEQQQIANALTEEQRAYAEEVVKYLSTTVGGWGNEASMRMFGYKKFNEDRYYPFHTHENYKKGNDGEDADTSSVVSLIKNKSFTHSTVKGAATPIKVENFSDVVGTHIVEMISYNTMAQAQSTMNAVFNYTKGTDTSVRASLENGYGEKAKRYVDSLIKDISGGATYDPNEGFANKMISRFKMNSVAANLAVIVQQPSAVGRAMAKIDPKYFLTTSPKNGYEECKKYSGIAVIKEVGGFDTSTGVSSAEWIMKNEPEGIKNKAKAFVNTKDSTYRNDVFGWAAGKADELTWAYIWQACKAEYADKNGVKNSKNLSEEQLKDIGMRFNEVIEATQVYDSVLTRSQFMRGKKPWVKMASAFMAEPTKRINMLYDAAYEFFVNKNKESGKYLMRTMGSVLVATIISATIKSFITAGRDDDENQAFMEKYTEAVIDNFFSELSILQGLPIVKDVISLFQGYDVTRTDMDTISTAINSLVQFATLFKDDFALLSEEERNEKIKNSIVDMFGAIGAFAGIPIKNIIRDCNMLVSTVQSALDDKTPSKEGLKYSTVDAFIGLFDNSVNNPLEGLRVNEKDLFNDMLDGNAEDFTAHWDEYQAYLIYSGKDEDKAFKAVRSNVKEQIKMNLFKENITDAEAEKYLNEYLGYDDGYWIVKEWHFNADEANEGINFSKYLSLERAVLAGEDITDEVKELTDHVTKESAVRNKVTSIIQDAFNNNEISEEKAQELLQKYKGFASKQSITSNPIDDNKDINRLVDSWVGNKDLPDDQYYTAFDALEEGVLEGMSIETAKEKLYSLEYNDSDINSRIRDTIRNALLDGDMTSTDARSKLMKYTDIEYEDAEDKVAFWNFQKQNPESKLSETGAIKYLEAKESGITLKVFEEYYSQVTGMTADKDANGKSITGSKRDKILKLINSLPLSSKQKDVLYYQNNYSAKTLYDTPWH